MGNMILGLTFQDNLENLEVFKEVFKDPKSAQTEDFHRFVEGS